MLLRLLLLVLPLCAGILSSAAETPRNKNPLIIREALIKPDALPQGSNATLVLRIQLDEGFHAYLDQFQIKIEEPANVQTTQPRVIPIVEFHDPVTKKQRQGVEGQAEIQTVFEIPENEDPGDRQLKFVLTYQACSKEYCLLPKKISMSTGMHVLKEEGRFGWMWSSAQEGSSLSQLEMIFQRGWLSALLLVFLGGILTSFTPCIFPMIPITLAILGTRGSERSRLHRLSLSLLYVLGIATTYSLLGLIAASTGMLFGSFLGHPMVAGGLGLLFIVMALSMFGLFEIQVPQSLNRRLGLQKTQGGFAGAYGSGVLAGVLASPCIGPVLVSILAWVAKSQNLLSGFVLLFTFALGMGQVFILLGTFGQARWWPKSGPWMRAIKYIFGLSMLALAFFYIRPLFNKAASIDTGASHKIEGKLNWQPYSDELLNNAVKSGKPIVLDFSADWCAACQEMEEQTFGDARVQTALENFVLLKFDATKPSALFDQLQERYGIYGLPWTVFYDAKGQVRNDLALAGFESADGFLLRLARLK